MKNILITGVAGFIGSNLANECIKIGLNVDGVDDFSNGHKEFVPIGMRTLYSNDFSDKNIVDNVEHGVYDTIFHLAAMPRVSYSVEHPYETNDVNVTKTLKLFEALRKVGNRTKLIFASSSSVYGGATVDQYGKVIGQSESDTKHPVSPYALQKSIIEDYAVMYANYYKCNIASMRFFNVFGKNQLGGSPYSTAISAWLTAIKFGKKLRFDGDGTQSRDMCHVDNVIHALILAGKSANIFNGDVYNVATGTRISNNEILWLINQRLPNKGMIMAPTRMGDVKHTLANISKIKNDLKYKPIVDVKTGIDMTIDWYTTNWEQIKMLSSI